MDIPAKTLTTMIPFKYLLEDHLKELLTRAEHQLVFEGDVLFNTGEYDQWCYYLVHGHLAVSNEQGSRVVDAATQLFPIAESQPRVATVKAVSDCQLIKVKRSLLDDLLCWSQIAEYLLTDFGLRRDLDEDIQWINTILKSNLFVKVPPVNAEQILTCLTPKLVEAGEVIIRQGEIGDRCYFIKEGSAEVTRVVDGEVQWLATIGPGRCFGEDALIHDATRNATITFTTTAVVMELSKVEFLKLLKAPSVSLVTNQELQQVDGSVVFVDVRLEEEYSEGHLKNAVNVPLNLISLKSRMLPKDKRYITCCQSGNRSKAAAYFLGKMGYQVSSLSEGIDRLAPNSEYLTKDDYFMRNGQVVSGH